MADFISMNFWLWLGVGCALFALEVFAPGSFLLWIGFASCFTAGVSFLFPSLSPFAQILIFGIATLLSVLIWYLYFQKKNIQPPPKHMNERAVQHVGRIFILSYPIVQGQGTLNINDTRWKIVGEDMPAGTTVKIEGVEGTFLRVKKI